jgi:hypothetical protein
VKREAEARERGVHGAEVRVAELERALTDQGLYDGTAEAARKAGRLDAELKEARRALDLAMAQWTKAVEAL